jgi:hypothetical protein
MSENVLYELLQVNNCTHIKVHWFGLYGLRSVSTITAIYRRRLLEKKN